MQLSSWRRRRMERATAAIQEWSPGLSEENYKPLNTIPWCHSLLPGSGPDAPEEEVEQAMGRAEGAARAAPR